MYYIYTDHLNTPRAITDTSNNLQWTWENKEAFGNNLPTEVVSGFKFNFRFPGQYFDIETNLNYNIHREYNPVWGKYTSSDPLGLAAGINTYGYVSGNSLMGSDRLGLLTEYWLFNRDISAGTFGHAAVRINGTVYSLYPKLAPHQNLGFFQSWFKNGEIVAQPVKDFIEGNVGAKVSVYTLNLSSQQEIQLNNYFQQKKKEDNITYNLIYGLGMEQCTSFSSGAINKIQSNLIIPRFSPNSAIDYLNLNSHNPMIKKVDTGIIK